MMAWIAAFFVVAFMAAFVVINRLRVIRLLNQVFDNGDRNAPFWR